MAVTWSSVGVKAPALWQFGIWRPEVAAAQSPRLPFLRPGVWLAEWQLLRADVLSPWQMGRALFLLAALSLLVSVGFWLAGFSPVMAFVCLEVAGLGMAMVIWMRHATDRDVISLRPDLLRVERHRAGQVDTVEFNPRWVRVEPDQLDGSLVRLSHHGRSVVVGDFVQRQHRRQLADEFRWALRHLDAR